MYFRKPFEERKSILHFILRTYILFCLKINFEVEFKMRISTSYSNLIRYVQLTEILNLAYEMYKQSCIWQ